MFSLNLTYSLLLLFCIITALTFEFINGFHDTANAVATVIYTNTLSPKIAVIWSGLWNFIGVNIGGIAVAMGIINLLPLEALVDQDINHNLALILAIIFTAILWNIGTWYLGIPCSSSHTLIGSITGVSIVFLLLPESSDVAMNWTKLKDVGLSLLISPLIGFCLALLLMALLRRLVRNKALFREPPARKAPPWWIRSILVLTCTSVSFSHGSNDGQKGIGLMMIILISLLPARFALDYSKNPAQLKAHAMQVSRQLLQVDTTLLEEPGLKVYHAVMTDIQYLQSSLAHYSSFADMPRSASLEIRKNILSLSGESSRLYELLPQATVTGPAWIDTYTRELDNIKAFTEYSPWWVILMISMALGLGTMIGWKRIVVTIGERIGKTHLTYAQGAVAEMIAASTISLSSFFGLPVSTTHVLSSGVAGTMVSESGMKNLQKKTVTAIGVAWLITIPVTVLFSGLLFLILRLVLI